MSELELKLAIFCLYVPCLFLLYLHHTGYDLKIDIPLILCAILLTLGCGYTLFLATDFVLSVIYSVLIFIGRLIVFCLYISLWVLGIYFIFRKKTP